MTIDSKHITDLYGIHNGYAVFATGKGRNKRYGIIDRDGKIVAEPEFWGSTLWFSNKRYIQSCTTASYNPRYRLFDTERGTWVAIDPNRRPWPIPGYDGLFYTHTQQNRYGIQDRAGRQIIPEKYGGIGRTGDNFIVANLQTGHLGIFTPDGEQIVHFSLKYGKIVAGDIGCLTLVEEKGKWFYIDNHGERIASKGIPELPAEATWVYPTKQYTIYGVEGWNTRKYGMLDENGYEVIPPIYDNIFTFNGKYVKTCMCDSLKDGLKEGLKDLSGNTVFPTEGHRTLNPISGDDDLIIVGVPNHTNPTYSDCGVVHVGPDRILIEVIPLRYTIPHFYGQGPGWIIAAEREFVHGRTKHISRYGIFLLDGRLTVPFEYDAIRSGNDPERIAACKDGKWFFINLKNERTLF